MSEHTPDNPPEWAMDRVGELCGFESASYRDWSMSHAFARYIATKEEPPVDPLLIEAREICASIEDARGYLKSAEQFRAGDHDGCHGPMMKTAMAALRRGMELARSEGEV